MKKKVLFPVILAAMTTVTFAQSQPSSEQMTKVSTSKKLTIETKALTKGVFVPVNSNSNLNSISTRANGVSYMRPEGTFWHGLDTEGMGYVESMLYLPPFAEIEFKNASDDPLSTTWSYNGNDLSDYVENGNLYFSYGISESGKYYPLPEIQKGKISFILGETNEGGSGVITNGNAETILSTTQITGFSTGYAGTKDYIYGTSENLDGETMYSSVITYEKPAAPLCISKIQYPMVSNTDKLLPEGKQMILKIRKAVPNQNGVLLPSEEVIYEMVADNSSFIKGFKFNQGPQTYWLEFSNKVKNPVTGTMEAIPFILNDAFALELCGFDQDGLDLGLLATGVEEGELRSNSYLRFLSNPDSYYSSRSTVPTNAVAMIVGYYNGISIDERTTSLKAPDAGGYAKTDDDNEFEFVAVTTTAEWLDDNDFTYDVEQPDWITIERDDSQRAKQGYYALIFECDPLPAGVESRHWTTSIQGFGDVKSDRKFTIYQGTKPVGVNETKANNTVKVVNTKEAFNLSYPETVTNVAIINVAGQTIATYDLPAAGNFTISSAELSNGIYFLKFNNNQTVKLIK